MLRIIRMKALQDGIMAYFEAKLCVIFKKHWQGYYPVESTLLGAPSLLLSFKTAVAGRNNQLYWLPRCIWGSRCPLWQCGFAFNA
jgi:hypothetical protein